jgi:hypothetical protein
LAEHARFEPPAWWKKQRPSSHRRERGEAGERPPDEPSGRIRIVWQGQRISRMVFPSGKTVEFTP